MNYVFIVVILCFQFAISYAGLDEFLKRYDLVDPISAKRRLMKRGTNTTERNSVNRIEEIQFYALNRLFRLILTPKRGLFSSKFELVSISNGSNIVDYIHIDPDEFMEGHVFGELVSNVTANVDENGAINALIHLADEIYTVEPAWRFLDNLPLNVSIIYRHSDLLYDRKSSRQPFCTATVPGQDNIVPNELDGIYTNQLLDALLASRSKRQTFQQVVQDGFKSAPPPAQTPAKRRCSVKLVADFRFFEHIGRKKASLTSRYLVNLIDRVNTIYTTTVWRDNEQQGGLSNMGFVIKKILIHSSPTNELEHYNSNKSDWTVVERLLQKFSEVEGSRNYCLVHLFTYQSFPNGVLGLGYIASAKEGSSGGICSAPIFDRGRYYYYNTALSSAKSSSGGAVVTREADIVTAHEFGHNWGSPHDSASSDCSPAQKLGGSYIMYTYSVSGYDENNKQFSPCSKRSIKSVLEAKAHLCFQEEETSFCGNQRVEAGEECDEGLLGDPDGGLCCTSECKFRANAKCSPKNSLCCSAKCQYEKVGTGCRERDPNRCLEQSSCNGQSPDCPPSDRMTDGTECLDRGECQRGICVSFCERREIGMKPCICENITQTCYRCCRQSNISECIPYVSIGGRPLVVSDGTRCIQGYCQAGKCMQKAADFVQHLWRIVDKLDINTFWKFLSDNIVGTIIVVSLLFWIPASCLVERWDERMRRERRDILERCENLDYILNNILPTPTDNVTFIQGVKSILENPAANPSPVRL